MLTASEQRTINRLSEGDVYSRVRAAVNTYAKPAVLTYLATAESAWVRSSVAKNKKTLPETLALLATDVERIVVVRVVAKNPNTPTDALKILATDDDPVIRGWAGENLKARVGA